MRLAGNWGGGYKHLGQGQIPPPPLLSPPPPHITLRDGTPASHNNNRPFKTGTCSTSDFCGQCSGKEDVQARTWHLGCWSLGALTAVTLASKKIKNKKILIGFCGCDLKGRFRKSAVSDCAVASKLGVKTKTRPRKPVFV